MLTCAYAYMRKRPTKRREYTKDIYMQIQTFFFARHTKLSFEFDTLLIGSRNTPIHSLRNSMNTLLNLLKHPSSFNTQSEIR